MLRVGVPEVRSLTPAIALRSRLVTIKVATGDDGPARAPTESEFAASARRKLDALGIAAAAELTLGKRRTLRIKQREIVGYEVLVAGLTSEESIRLQEQSDPENRLQPPPYDLCDLYAGRGRNDCEARP